jgi:hypothetical protein
MQPLNGWTQAALVLRCVLLRGLKTLDGAWHLLAATPNLLGQNSRDQHDPVSTVSGEALLNGLQICGRVSPLLQPGFQSLPR